MRRLYFTYGSLMNEATMRMLAPDSVCKGVALVNDYMLTFRKYATIEKCTDEVVAGKIYEVSEAGEARLDRYEGFPNLYRKETLLTADGREVLVYVMNNGQRDAELPDRDYYEDMYNHAPNKRSVIVALHDTFMTMEDEDE